MRCTPSHAAAVLPFLRTPLPASALVVGSITPDLPYYLPGNPGLFTHTATAVVTTDLALGALAWAVWHAVLAAPALAASPAGLRARRWWWGRRPTWWGRSSRPPAGGARSTSRRCRRSTGHSTATRGRSRSAP